MNLVQKVLVFFFIKKSIKKRVSEKEILCYFIIFFIHYELLMYLYFKLRILIEPIHQYKIKVIVQ